MPRVPLPDLDPEADDGDDFEPRPRRSRPPVADGPRLVREGASGHRAVDTEEPLEADSPLSSYDVAAHGPDPVPDWLVTELAARDTRLGIVKTGKEADVSLLERSVPGGPGCLLAVKTYRDSTHRMFQRDAGYQEGRAVRRSRETRALAKRTAFGRELMAGKWAAAEFDALSRLYRAGAPVPYPVQIIGSELMMEFIGAPDGTAAPRLAAFSGNGAEGNGTEGNGADGNGADWAELWHGLVGALERLAEQGLTHGDLSAYNVLVHEDRCVLIDLPQVVDVVANPQGQLYLERDCANIADFFARWGVAAADGELLALHLGSIARAG